MRIYHLACLLLVAGVTNSIWRRLANTFNKRLIRKLLKAELDMYLLALA